MSYEGHLPCFTCISERCRIGSSPERDILGWTEADNGQVACHCYVICTPTQGLAMELQSVGCLSGVRP